MKLRKLVSGLVLASSFTSVQAAPFNDATIRRIVDGNEVFIDQRPAKINQQATRGQNVSTGRSRAELLFDRRALGFLGRNSLIRLGESCFKLQQGQVLVNGPQNSCLGNKILGIRGTTYVLSSEKDGGYRLSVLAGEAVVGDAVEASEISADILQQFPTLTPVIGFGSSAWGSNAGGTSLGEAAGLILGDTSFFLPLYQHESQQLFYSYSTANSNFDGVWGASTELGYKWFNPTNRSTNSLLVGYDGWQEPSCFHSQVSLGGLWEQGRWSFGINGGIPMDRCENNLGYAIGRLGIPIADLGKQSVTLSLSPYVMHGIGNTYGGGKIGINVPVSDHLALSAYGQYDGLLDTVVGGQISYRFSTNGQFLNDPNRPAATTQSPLPWKSSGFQSGKPMQIALGGTEATPQAVAGSHNPIGLLTQHKSTDVILAAGEEALFDRNGMLLKRERLDRERYSQLIESTMSGHNLLPESQLIQRTYEQLFGTPDRELLAILGSDWLIAARTPYPRRRAASNLVVPDDKLPKDETNNRDNNDDAVDDDQPNDDKGDSDVTDTDTTPSQDTTPAELLTYVCKASSGNPDFPYFTGSGYGGPLSDAVRFTTTSESDASCDGKSAGSDGREPTNAVFL